MNFYKTKVFITSLTLSSTAFSQLGNDLKPNKDEAKEVAEEALKPLAISPTVSYTHLTLPTILRV